MHLIKAKLRLQQHISLYKERDRSQNISFRYGHFFWRNQTNANKIFINLSARACHRVIIILYLYQRKQNLFFFFNNLIW